MADQLYLSLWFPNFRLDALPAALISVMQQFALISVSSGRNGANGSPDGKRVTAAATYPISFSEAPTYQRLYVNDNRSEDTSSSIIENAVSEATEQLHDDMAYEFEMKWSLWAPDSGPGSPAYAAGDEAPNDIDAHLDTVWRPGPATVKIIGFGPSFDEGDFQQNGHIRVDFGLDYPWVLDDDAEMEEEEEEDSAAGSNVVSMPSSTSSAVDEAATYIQKNVELLLAFTLSVEKHCGISSRLLWTESGEPLAEKLIARLQRLN